MRIDIISVVPELLDSPFQHSIMKRAQQKGLYEVVVHNLRDYGIGRHKQIDDYQFGGGAGMVMKIEPIANCINDLKAQRSYDEVIFLTPDGKKFDQPMANRLSMYNNLILLCGHYKGIDERIREHFISPGSARPSDLRNSARSSGARAPSSDSTLPEISTTGAPSSSASAFTARMFGSVASLPSCDSSTFAM